MRNVLSQGYLLIVQEHLDCRRLIRFDVRYLWFLVLMIKWPNMTVFFQIALLSIAPSVCSTCSAQATVAATPPPSQTAIEARDHGAILQFVNIPTKSLPKHVQMVGAIRTAPLIPVTRNPELSVDPQRISPIAKFFGIIDEQELAAVRASVVALYQENDPANEIGVYGIYYSDAKAANEQFKKLANDNDDPPFFLKGRLLLFVWKDDQVSNAACEAHIPHVWWS
jgi:hypothetical protein